MRLWPAVLLLLPACAVGFEGAARIPFNGYPDCIELKNATTRVVLGHHMGGRVLSYDAGRGNILYLVHREDESPAQPSAGRFDIGPEMLQTRGAALWSGGWSATVTGDRAAKMVSAIDPASGFRVERTFALAPEGSRLSVTQTVTNEGPETARACYWSRTFAVHGGSVVVPLTPETRRFPEGYILYRSGRLIDVRPDDPAVQRYGDLLVLGRPAEHAKLGFDTTAGWVAYQHAGQLFVKRYPADPAKPYGEATGMTLSIWYPEAGGRLPACEIEPIGPLETLAPGQKASFTAHWWLLPAPVAGVDAAAIGATVSEHCQLPPPR